MADAARYGYHASTDDYKAYIRRLYGSPIIQIASAEEQRENWERLKKRGRG